MTTMPQSNLVASNSIDRAAFEGLYAGPAPWDIGKPQPASRTGLTTRSAIATNRPCGLPMSQGAGPA